MFKLTQNGNNRGFSLLEVVMAVAIGALLMVSLTTVFQVNKQNWNVNNRRSEMLQHARVAMSRLSTELRYATNLVQADSSTIVFETTELLDMNNSTTETIRYENGGFNIQRSVDGGTRQIIAGDEKSTGIQARFSSIVPVKLDVSNNVVPLDVSDPLSTAIGLQFTMTIQDSSAQQLSVTTMVKFRWS